MPSLIKLTFFFVFLKDSGQAIPLVVESCIRFINLYGKRISAQCVQFTVESCWEKMIFSVALEDFLSLLCSREWLLLRALSLESACLCPG